MLEDHDDPEYYNAFRVPQDPTDVRKCVTELKKIGLEVNPSKCDTPT